MSFKTETNGKGKTRRDPRAIYKAKSKVLRRAFGKTECHDGIDEWEWIEEDRYIADLIELQERAIKVDQERLAHFERLREKLLDGSVTCTCFFCAPEAMHCCHDCAPCILDRYDNDNYN